MHRKKVKYVAKWAVGIGGSLVLLVVGFLWIFNVWLLDSWVQNRLDQYLETRLAESIAVTFNRLDADLWQQSLELGRIEVHKAGENEDKVKLSVYQFNIEDFNLISFLWDATVSIHRLKIQKPELRVTKELLSSLKEADSSEGDGLNLKSGFYLDHINVTNAHFSIYSPSSEQKEYQINGLELQGKNLMVDIRRNSLVERPNSYSTFTIGNITLKVQQFEIDWDQLEYKDPRGYYRFVGGSGTCSSSYGSCSWSDLKLIPQLPRHRFSKFVGYQTDRMRMHVNKVSASHIKMDQLDRGAVIADKVAVSGGSLSVFRDKQWPELKKEKTLPHVALKNMDSTIDLDTVTLRKFNVRYSEQKPGIGEPGYITFSDLQANFYGITNDSARLGQKHHIRFDAHGKVMDAAQIDIRARVPMHKEGKYNMQGKVGRMKLSRLNSMIAPLLLLRIKSGVMQQLRFDMSLGSAESSGEVYLTYEDLAVEMLNKKDIKEGGHKEMLSFLANNFKVKSDSETPASKGHISFERVPYKSLFNYGWKSLASGLKDGIGL